MSEFSSALPMHINGIDLPVAAPQSGLAVNGRPWDQDFFIAGVLSAAGQGAPILRGGRHGDVRVGCG
jgi:hypothetical protein